MSVGFAILLLLLVILAQPLPHLPSLLLLLLLIPTSHVVRRLELDGCADSFGISVVVGVNGKHFRSIFGDGDLRRKI